MGRSKPRQEGERKRVREDNMRTGRKSLLVRSSVVVAGFCLMAILGVGCGVGGSSGQSSGTNASGGKLDVVATTTQIGDLASNVGGGAVNVHQILQPNTDPHEYEPRPGDVKATAGAKLVFENGDNLDKWMDKVVSEAGGKPKVVNLGKGVPVKLPGEESGPEASRYDPHWWHDPKNAEAAVKEIRDALIKADPKDEETYRNNAKVYLTKLGKLDAGISSCMGKVPKGGRKLVTDHDAFGYFAKRYGVDVVGAVIPSQTTQSQPSAKETSQLISLIKREHVKAVFPESSINPKLAQQISRETDASSNYTLYGDTLGEKGSSGSTYLKMEAANANSMVKGFTGGKESCSIPVGG